MAMVMVFPGMIGFMVYLDSALVTIGCVAALLVSILKCIIVVGTGNQELLVGLEEINVAMGTAVQYRTDINRC